MWEVRIQHEGLRACRVLKGPTQADAQWKATAQLLRWEARWNSQQKANLFRQERQSRQMLALHGRATANALTAESTERVAALGSILHSSLKTGIFLHWDLLMDRSAFAEPPVLPEPRRMPPPQLLKAFYTARLTFFERLLPWRRRKKEREASDLFERDLAAWRTACQLRNDRADRDFRRRTAERERHRLRHEAAQLKQHAKVTETRTAFEDRDEEAVEYFFSEVLSRSAYPREFPEEATLHYQRPSGTLIVQYELPSIASWPTAKQFHYLPEHNMLREVTLPKAWLKRSYENALYQIALRVLHELFTHDDAQLLETVAFNGWTRALDKATGNQVHARILSIQVTRQCFSAINLAHVDPRACFRKLKGVLSSDPLALVPVRAAPSLPDADGRFVDPRGVAASKEQAGRHRQSVVSMKRSDFENLIREAFEREFRKNRAQLTVAQADHGVPLDA